MKILSGILCLTLASAAAIASANAADMYRAPEAGGYKDGPAYAGVNWGGLYVGVNGGYGWSAYNDQLAFAVYGYRGLSSEGAFGGGQAGYNWQVAPHLVLGAEADIQGAGLDGSGSVPGGGTYKSQVDMFGTVRGRIGVAVDRALVYFTGGLAYGNVENVATPCIGCYTYSKTGIATGYVLGGGVEYKVNPSWSIKGEYQYIDLGKNDPTDPNGRAYSSFGSFGAVVREDAYHTARVGLNYHIRPGYEPLK